ncbi:hypothetical protein [Rhodococcus coprophilus]|nr:hypothetical protein [Rhodococcus coprophilus]
MATPSSTTVVGEAWHACVSGARRAHGGELADGAVGGEENG